MSDLQAIADRVEIEALRSEFTDIPRHHAADGLGAPHPPPTDRP
jgi:hypothetical protein